MIAFFSLLGTIVIYMASKRFYRFKPLVFLTPLLVTPIIVIALILCSGISFNAYNAGAHWLTDMIGPGTVAMAVPLYKNWAALKRHAVEIIVSVLSGATLAICLSDWMANRMHLSEQIVDSLAPHSATTPIAMAASQVIGGNPTITAVFVMLTGLTGMILGPLFIKLLGISSHIARGVLFGTSSHNAGTAKAFELSSVSGSISSIAMILTAFFTLCVAPLLL